MTARTKRAQRELSSVAAGAGEDRKEMVAAGKDLLGVGGLRLKPYAAKPMIGKPTLEYLGTRGRWAFWQVITPWGWFLCSRERYGTSVPKKPDRWFEVVRVDRVLGDSRALPGQGQVQQVPRSEPASVDDASGSFAARGGRCEHCEWVYEDATRDGHSNPEGLREWLDAGNHFQGCRARESAITDATAGA